MLEPVQALRHAHGARQPRGQHVLVEQDRGAATRGGGAQVLGVGRVRRDVLVVRRVGLVAGGVHVLARGGPGLGLGLGVGVGVGVDRGLGLGLRDVHGGLHVGVVVERGGLEGVVLQLVLGVEVEGVVVVVALGVDLVAFAVDGGGGGEGHSGLGLDGAAVAGPGGGRVGLRGLAGERGAAGVGQLLLGGHACGGGAGVAHDGAPLVDEAVKVPVAEVDALRGQLLGGVGAQGNDDGGVVGGAAGPEAVELAAGVLELQVGVAAGGVGAGVAAQDLELPVLVAGGVGLQHPVVVGVGDVAEELLRVGVAQRRGGQRRGRGGGVLVVGVVGGVQLVQLALALQGQQALAHAAVEGVELLLGGRRQRPRLGGGEGRRREQRRRGGQHVQAQGGEVERVGVEVEEAGARGLVGGLAHALQQLAQGQLGRPRRLVRVAVALPLVELQLALRPRGLAAAAAAAPADVVEGAPRLARVQVVVVRLVGGARHQRRRPLAAHAVLAVLAVPAVRAVAALPPHAGAVLLLRDAALGLPPRDAAAQLADLVDDVDAVGRLGVLRADVQVEVPPQRARRKRLPAEGAVLVLGRLEQRRLARRPRRVHVSFAHAQPAVGALRQCQASPAYAVLQRYRIVPRRRQTERVAGVANT